MDFGSESCMPALLLQSVGGGLQARDIVADRQAGCSVGHEDNPYEKAHQNQP